MAPAFSSPRQAFAFLLLLSGLLVLPLIAGHWNLTARPDAYATMPESTGPYSFLHQQIFDETSDVDIAFVGASVLLFQIDTPYVQKTLSAQLGHDAHVMSLATLWTAEDRNYFVLRDLLEHRKVKLVVLCMLQENKHYENGLFVWGYRFFQPGRETDEAIAGLPLSWRAAFYADEVLGTPRQLYSRLVPPLNYLSPEAQTLGMHPRKISYGGDEASFVPFTPPPLNLPADAMIYSAATSNNFHFVNGELAPYQKHFVAGMGKLLREHGVRLVILDIPPRFLQSTIQEKHMIPGYWPTPNEPRVRYDQVQEFCYWPDIFGMPLDMVGLPQSQLLQGLTDEQVDLIHSDRLHLNANGCAFYTRTITPALIKLYENQDDHH